MRSAASTSAPRRRQCRTVASSDFSSTAASAATSPEAEAEAGGAASPEALARLRSEVARRESALSLARQALALAERKLNTAHLSASPEAYDDQYGFARRFAGGMGASTEGRPPVPQGALASALRTFTDEAVSLASWLANNRRDALKGLESERATALRSELAELTLSNDAIWEREHARPGVRAPWTIKGPYLVLCWLLDNVFDGRPLARLWFLETVARIPYQSYTVMLQLYESLGWWRLGAQAQRVHFAEAWNELHHLYIMEALGGDREWRDRFFAAHASFTYFFILCIVWLISPTLSYNFSELIEAHAVDTYAQFCDENRERLQRLPAPAVAVRYFTTDLYLYDEFQSSKESGSRRPRIDTLYDVFATIRDDEAEHVSTMATCQDEQVLLRSPNLEAALTAAAAAAVLAESIYSALPEEGMAGLGVLLSMAEDVLESGL